MTLGGEWNVKIDLSLLEKQTKQQQQKSVKGLKVQKTLVTVYHVAKNIPAGRAIELQKGRWRRRPGKLNQTDRS